MTPTRRDGQTCGRDTSTGVRVEEERCPGPSPSLPPRWTNGCRASRTRSRAGTPRRRPSCSSTTATGATSSPSRGTSRPSRGRRASRTCSRRRSRSAKPRGFATTEPPAEAEGVTEAWFEFETETGRGHGLLRLKDGKAWTLLTALRELKGHEEPRGAGAPARRRARRRPRPRDLAGGAPPRGRGARAHAPALRRDRRRRPGRDRARRAAAPARRPDDHRRAQRAPRRLLAQALQVALPARPGLVRPPALHQVPRELAGVLAEGQDRRLAGDVHAGDGAQLLGLHDRQAREATTRTNGEWVADRRARRRRHHAAPEAARARAGHVEQAQPARDRGHGRLQGRPAPLLPAPRARTPTAARSAS